MVKDQELSKIKVLCVEDEEDIRENIVEILRDEGFTAIGAENGKAGFERFLKENPDIIVSDIMMPEIDGFGLLKLIRESKNVRNQNIPFIFLSALGQKEHIITGVQKGANDYLTKPVDFDLLIAKIKEKTSNLIKVQESHKQNIQNIKEQVSTILPSQLIAHVDNISQISANLKEEPYGPLPHRAYLENINRIYLESLRLKAAIANFLDSQVLDAKLQANEEIFKISDFINELIGSFNKQTQKQIEFETPFDEESLPKIKADKFILLDATRKILAKLLKMNADCNIKISVIINHLEQIAIIFYSHAKHEAKSKFPVNSINAILASQDCHIELRAPEAIEDLQIILTIPDYKTINS